jgi:hypothetical protein
LFNISNTDFGLIQNGFLNSGGSYVYKASLAACRQDLYNGGFRWYTAPSGTAGNAITFTQAMTLDASGNLMVGTTTPVFNASGRGLITINGSSAAAVGFTASGADKGIILHTGTDMIMSNSVAGAITFQTTNTERARIPAAGGFQSKTTISVGDATPSLSGAGITFPASQSASTDANTLDDYEEGTWTPTATAGTGSITAFTAEATYVKVGSVVTVRAAVKLTTPGTAGGSLIITGYPFTSYNYTDNSRASTFLVREDALTGVAYQGFISDNSTGGEIATMNNGAITWTTNSVYIFQATYHTAF